MEWKSRWKNLVFSHLDFLQLYSYLSRSSTRERSQMIIQPTWLEAFWTKLCIAVLNWSYCHRQSIPKHYLILKRNNNHDIALASFPPITHAITNLQKSVPSWKNWDRQTLFTVDYLWLTCSARKWRVFEVDDNFVQWNQTGLVWTSAQNVVHDSEQESCLNESLLVPVTTELTPFSGARSSDNERTASRNYLSATITTELTPLNIISILSVWKPINYLKQS